MAALPVNNEDKAIIQTHKSKVPYIEHHVSAMDFTF